MSRLNHRRKTKLEAMMAGKSSTLRASMAGRFTLKSSISDGSSSVAYRAETWSMIVVTHCPMSSWAPIPRVEASASMLTRSSPQSSPAGMHTARPTLWDLSMATISIPHPSRPRYISPPKRKTGTRISTPGRRARAALRPLTLCDQMPYAPGRHTANGKAWGGITTISTPIKRKTPVNTQRVFVPCSSRGI